MKLMLLVSAAAAAHAAAPKVLVFGDSWGSFGPSYKALSEMFSSRNISANVQVHPTHGKAGATTVMDAFWTLYFSKQLNLSAALPRSEPAVVTEDAPLELPCTGAGYDANAAGDTSVAEARCMWQWKPS